MAKKATKKGADFKKKIEKGIPENVETNQKKFFIPRQGNRKAQVIAAQSQAEAIEKINK